MQSRTPRPSLSKPAFSLTGIILFALALPAFGQYVSDIDRWTTQDALDPPDSGAVLFVGSSSIRRYEQLTLDFNDYRILQRGFGGALFDHVNLYVNDIVLPYNPTAIVIWAGTNDLAGGSDGLEVFDDYQQFVSAVLTAQPTVEIFYIGIMPTPGRFSNGPEETVANNAIANEAAGNPRLHYIDMPSVFYALNPPSDPNFTSLFVDSIHLNRTGYELWTSVIRPELEAVVPPNKVFTLNPLTPQPGQRILFDFGPNNPEDGDLTVNPDVNGNYWNNWHAVNGEVHLNSGEHLGNLFDDQGVALGIDLTLTADFLPNGKLNGGLLSPDPNLLGDLAIATATEDYFFCTGDNLYNQGSDDVAGGFMLAGLDPSLAYNFRFFGSRNTTATRITEYKVTGANTSAVQLVTSGLDIGADGAYDGNDDEFAEVPGIRPDAFGQVFVDLTLISGAFAYVNVMEITVSPLGDGDLDADRDVDDYLSLIECLDGDGQSPVPADCLPVFDFDYDLDVDLRDLAAMQPLGVYP